MLKAQILIVDDNQKIHESLSKNLCNMGFETYYAPDSAHAVQVILKESVDVILLDIMLGNESGIDVLRNLKQINAKIPIIMITGYASIDSAVQSMKMGAFDYLKKPFELERLLKLIENALELTKLSHENIVLKQRLQELSNQICIESRKMHDIIEQATKLAKTDIPVLIIGENGSGKEVIGDYIHIHSSRFTQKMIKINCAAFPETLLDNELFGHEKGAYTGADSQFKGVFERAHTSTLFLDEIGDMPLTIQAKILRVLQNNEIRRIGGSETLKVDVRFIAATNKEPEELIRNGSFREDLFYRLNTATINIPPLRERKEDIASLINYFLEVFSVSHAKIVQGVTDTVYQMFLAYNWPGNVRELKNAINYAVAITSHDYIDLVDLPPAFHKHGQPDRKLGIREEIERSLIMKTLQQYDFNKKKTAELLNMSRKTLYAKLEKYRIYGR